MNWQNNKITPSNTLRRSIKTMLAKDDGPITKGLSPRTVDSAFLEKEGRGFKRRLQGRSVWVEVFKEHWELKREEQQQAQFAGNGNWSSPKGNTKFSSATEGLAGRKAGGCLGKEQDALGEWMNEQHPTHFPDRWCQFVNCSSHKKRSYMVSNNSVFPWWPWQWALLLTTHQQSPWCHGEKSWLRDNLGGPESNRVQHTLQYQHPGHSPGKPQSEGRMTRVRSCIWKGCPALLTDLTTSWCWPFNWSALILRTSSQWLEICRLTVSHLLKGNALLNKSLAGLSLFNLFAMLTYSVSLATHHFQFTLTTLPCRHIPASVSPCIMYPEWNTHAVWIPLWKPKTQT